MLCCMTNGNWIACYFDGKKRLRWSCSVLPFSNTPEENLLSVENSCGELLASLFTMRTGKKCSRIRCLRNCAFFFTWRVSVLGSKPNTNKGAKRRSLILQLKSFPKLLSDQFIGQKGLFFAAWEVYIRVVIRCSRQSYLSGNMWNL